MPADIKKKKDKFTHDFTETMADLSVNIDKMANMSSKQNEKIDNFLLERDNSAKNLHRMNSHMHKISKKVDSMEKVLIKILKKKSRR